MRRSLQPEADNRPQTTRKPSSFSELAERWKVAEGATLGDSTLKHYWSALRAYVIPEFGTSKLEDVTRW